MPTPFFARIKNAGYAQYPDLMEVTPLPGYVPGSPPPRPTPQPPVDPGYSPPWAQVPGGPVDPGYSPPWATPRPPLDFWGPNDPRPTHPIVLPPSTPIPPAWIGTLPPPGEPGSPSNPFPPGEVPPGAVEDAEEFYLIIPYVGVVGPYTMPPVGMTPPPTTRPGGDLPPIPVQPPQAP